MKDNVLTTEDLSKMMELNADDTLRSELPFKTMNELLELKELKEKELDQIDKEILLRKGVEI